MPRYEIHGQDSDKGALNFRHFSGAGMETYKMVIFAAFAALLSGCAFMDSLVSYDADPGSARRTYGVTLDRDIRADFPVSYREVDGDYHASHVEWVYQPHVKVTEPPVVTQGNP